MKIPALLLPFLPFAVLQAETLLDHTFGGAPEAALHQVAPDVNTIRPVAWNAGPIIAANGQVNDVTNTDQGLVFDLGLSWIWAPQSTYSVTLEFTNLSNAIVFAGFRTTNSSGSAQVQTQGTACALRVREISGSDNVGIFNWPGGAFTDSGLTYDTNTAGSFTLTIATNDLSDATFTVGSAVVPVDLTLNTYRYFFAGYEDPTTGTSDAKFTRVTLTGPPQPALPPLPALRLASYDTVTGNASVAWTTVTGQLHTLMRSADLKVWVPVDSSDLFPFGGAGEEITVTHNPGATRQFYRLIHP